MEVTDVTDWYVITDEPEGQDENKLWLSKSPGADRDNWWLWKPRLGTGKDKAHPRYSDVAEVLAFRLAQRIGLPAAECELATFHNKPGAISRNLTPDGTDLIHGNSLAPFLPYSLATIDLMLTSDIGVPPQCEGMSARQVFAGYLVLDAWIANTDRHGGNWAVVEDGQRRTTLLPAYDHGSALGSGLTDERRLSRSLAAFCEAGRTRYFTEGGTLLDLAATAVRTSGASWWPQRVADVSPEHWRGILGGIEGLSDIARTFMDGILTRNQERVSTLCQR